MSKSHRIGFVSFLGLALAGCYDGGPSQAADTDAAGTGGTGATDGVGTVDEGSGTANNDESADGDDNSTTPIPDPPDGCLPGAVGCECLDGTCEGLSTCEDDICIPGPPIPEVDGDGSAIAGVAISLSGDIDDDDNIAGYDQLQWTQLEGPDATILHEFGTDAVAYLPDDAPVGMEFVFRLSASLGDVATFADYGVTILGATATGPMDDAKEAVALAGSTFAPANDGYWIGTGLGNFARIDDDAVSAEYDLLSPIADIVRYSGGVLLVAQPDLQTVTGFNSNNNMATPFLTELSGGAPLGAVSVLAVDGDDNVYIGTAEGDILFYDSPDGAEPATSTVMDTLTTTPTAFALSDIVVAPEDDEGDEGNVLYIGTIDGDVLQLGLSAPEDNSELEIGVATSYLSVPGTGPVTGLTVDGLGNMWVGKSSGVYLVRRAPQANPEVVRTIAATTGLGGFSGLRTDDGRLVWIDPASGRVGSMVAISQ